MRLCTARCVWHCALWQLWQKQQMPMHQNGRGPSVASLQRTTQMPQVRWLDWAVLHYELWLRHIVWCGDSSGRDRGTPSAQAAARMQSMAVCLTLLCRAAAQSLPAMEHSLLSMPAMWPCRHRCHAALTNFTDFPAEPRTLGQLTMQLLSSPCKEACPYLCGRASHGVACSADSQASQT